MTGRHFAVAAVLGLFATSAAADNAVRRDGSSGGSRDTGSRHTPGVHSSGSSRSGGSSGSSWSSGGGSSRELTPAQRRQPRPGTGTGGRRGGGYYPGYHYPYYPGGYYGYGSYWWPYGSFYYGRGYYYPYSAGYYGYGYGYGYRDRAALRLLVDPAKARVYVDGYYAGVVDDYDGLFQRLHVSPGRHEIAFKLEGYQPHRVKVYVASGSTLKIHYDMREGTGPETFEDLAGDVDERYARRDRYDRRDREAEDEDVEAEPPRAGDAAAGAELGRLRLTVRPEDASVYVDGQFKGSGRQAGSIELPPGKHRVEVVRPGFRTEERDVEVEAGETRELEVELQRP